MDAQALSDIVHRAVPEAEVHPYDLNGGGDHWFCAVVSPTFEGQRPLARQRPILDAFTPHFQSGAVHALDLKCMTPAEVDDKGLPQPFVPHREGEGSHPRSWPPQD